MNNVCFSLNFTFFRIIQEHYNCHVVYFLPTASHKLPDNGEGGAEGEGLLVALRLDGIGVTDLEAGTGNDAGTASEGEGHGEGVKLTTVGIEDRDRLVLRDVQTAKKERRLLGCLAGRHRRCLADAATHGEDGAAFKSER